VLGDVSDEKCHCCTVDWINEDSFIGFTKYLLGKYGKMVFVLDRATHHWKSMKMKMFVKECNSNLILWPLPKRLPELNPMEQVGRVQG